jgi:hypothetical protein
LRGALQEGRRRQDDDEDVAWKELPIKPFDRELQNGEGDQYERGKLESFSGPTAGKRPP